GGSSSSGNRKASPSSSSDGCCEPGPVTRASGPCERFTHGRNAHVTVKPMKIYRTSEDVFAQRDGQTRKLAGVAWNDLFLDRVDLDREFDRATDVVLLPP